MSDLVTKEFTIHLHKHLYGTTFKKRAPKAIKIIKQFATKAFKTTDVRIDVDLNKAVWAQGVKGVNHRIRVRLERKRNDADSTLYTLVTFVPVTNFKGLQTVTVDE